MSSSQGWVFRQCSRESCGFRFPVESEIKRARFCPKCGAETIVAAKVGPQTMLTQEPSISNSTILEGLLDNLRSTFNVGAIFRTADGAGFRHLHLCGITPTPNNPKVGKTALGAEVEMSWSYCNNSLVAAQNIVNEGAILWALESAPDAIPIFSSLQEKPASRLVLIVGNERAGVDPELLSLCERIVWIPMRGKKESLNVAVAFSIAAYILRYG